MRLVSVFAGVALVLLVVSTPGFESKAEAQIDCDNACTSCNDGETCALDAATGQCRCFPLICCNCEGLTEITACPETCEDTLVDAAVCIGACLLANVLTPCNINVLLLTQCQGDPEACPTTGCCQFDFCTANPEQCDADELGTIPSQICTGSNALQCDIFDGTFIEDGSCDGVTGTCNSPTPTDTPTATPTDTPTATPTDTPTATPTDTPTATPTDTPSATPTDTPTATPTDTPVPEGGPCMTTSQCQLGLFCIDGICQSAAPAPTASNSGLLVSLGILVAIALVALWRRRELKHYLWSI